MDIFLLVAGAILLVTGIIGCIVPALPGTPLAYLALVLLQFTSHKPFSTTFLVIWLLVTILVSVLDYIVPIWGAKKFGGSKRGMLGAGIGMVVGIFFFPPFGMLIGPFAGAVIGELSLGKDQKDALKAGWGSFLGFLTGIAMKLVVSLVMGYYFVRAATQIMGY